MHNINTFVHASNTDNTHPQNIPKGDVWCSVVDDCKRRHPKVIPQPRHEPKLDPPSPTGVVDNGRKANRHECKHSGEADDDAGLLCL